MISGKYKRKRKVPPVTLFIMLLAILLQRCLYTSESYMKINVPNRLYSEVELEKLMSYINVRKLPSCYVLYDSNSYFSFSN